MVAILIQREISAFFDSLIGYIVLALFLVGVGLFMWVFPGNVLQTYQASLDTLFSMAPWFFLFLIPAITMRSFAEEFRSGTIEYLATKPLTDWQILLGKYLATVLVVLLALLPTLIYFFSLKFLTAEGSSIDTGATIGAYLGLLGIGAVFCAIGTFASTLTSSQIVAFLFGVFFCFFLYSVFDFLAELEFWGQTRGIIMNIGISEHYRSISRGVIDTRDVLYYLSLIIIFLVLGKAVLTSRKA